MPTVEQPAPLPDPADVDRPWLAAYPPGVPVTWSLPDVPLTRFVDDAARDFPMEPAVWSHGTTLSWSALADLVDRFATVLQRLGAAHGDRVAVAVPDSVAGIVALFAASRLGAIAALVDPAQPDSAASFVGQVGAMVAVVDEAVAQALQARRDDLPDLQQVVVADPRSGLPARGLRARLQRRSRHPGLDGDGAEHAWDEVLADAAPIVPQGPVAGVDPALVVRDRQGELVTLTQANLVAASFQARLWVPDVRAGRERLLSLLPPATSTSVVVGTLAPALAAGCIVLAGADDPVDVIHRARPTIMAAPPVAYRGIVEHHRRRDLTSIRVAVTGGAPLATGVAAEFERVAGGAHLRQGHGVAAAPITHATPVYGRAMAGSIGLPVTDTVAAVVGPDGAPCAADEVGELVVSGPQVAVGGTARTTGGWLRTGTRAEQSADGTFRLVGRAARADVAEPLAREPAPTAEEAD